MNTRVEVILCLVAIGVLLFVAGSYQMWQARKLLRAQTCSFPDCDQPKMGRLEPWDKSANPGYVCSLHAAQAAYEGFSTVRA